MSAETKLSNNTWYSGSVLVFNEHFYLYLSFMNRKLQGSVEAPYLTFHGVQGSRHSGGCQQCQHLNKPELFLHFAEYHPANGLLQFVTASNSNICNQQLAFGLFVIINLTCSNIFKIFLDFVWGAYMFMVLAELLSNMKLYWKQKSHFDKGHLNAFLDLQGRVVY